MPEDGRRRTSRSWRDDGIPRSRRSASSARGEKLLNEGKNIDEVCKHLEVSAPTWHRWVAQYGGMKGEDAKRLKELGEAESAVEEDRRRSGLGHRHAQGADPGKLVSPDRQRRAVQVLGERFGCPQRRACRVVGQSRSSQLRHNEAMNIKSAIIVTAAIGLGGASAGCSAAPQAPPAQTAPTSPAATSLVSPVTTAPTTQSSVPASLKPNNGDHTSSDR